MRGSAEGCRQQRQEASGEDDADDSSSVAYGLCITMYYVYIVYTGMNFHVDTADCHMNVLFRGLLAPSRTMVEFRAPAELSILTRQVVHMPDNEMRVRSFPPKRLGPVEGT